MQSAARVGFLVVVFFGLLIGGYYLLGASLFGKKHVLYYADMADAGGITNGTGITMSGVPVGSVGGVKLLRAGQARITLDLDPSVQIPQGSTATMAGSLIGLGESSLDIVPPAKPNGRFLPPGSILIATKSNALDNMFPEARETMHELAETLHSVRKLIENNKLQASVEGLLATSDRTMQKFGVLADHASRLMGDNQAAIHSAVQNAAEAMAEVNKSSQLVAKLLQDGKLQSQTTALLDELKTTTEKAGKVMDDLTALVDDPKLHQNLNDTMQSVATVAKKGETIADNTVAISENGKIVSEKAIKLADDAHDIAVEAKTLIDKLNKLVDKLPTAPKIGPIHAEMDLMRETKPNYWRSDFDVSSKIGQDTVHAGLYDAFGNTRFNLQLAHPFSGNGDYRWGVYASKPGLGVDYSLARGTTLRGDLFDLNSPRLDLFLSQKFGDDFYGWLGVERLFHENVAAIGVGIRK